MTGGTVVVLGATGRNFAAGMSGGVAYVYDPKQRFKANCNLDMVELESLVDEAELETVRALIERHCRLTNSPHARRLLDDWSRQLTHFVKVMPTDYKRVLQTRAVQMKLCTDAPVSAGGTVQ